MAASCLIHSSALVSSAGAFQWVEDRTLPHPACHNLKAASLPLLSSHLSVWPTPYFTLSFLSFVSPSACQLQTSSCLSFIYILFSGTHFWKCVLKEYRRRSVEERGKKGWVVRSKSEEIKTGGLLSLTQTCVGSSSWPPAPSSPLGHTWGPQTWRRVQSQTGAWSPNAAPSSQSLAGHPRRCLPQGRAGSPSPCRRYAWGCSGAAEFQDPPAGHEQRKSNNSPTPLFIKFIFTIFWWIIPIRQTCSSNCVGFQLPEWLRPPYSLSPPRWCCAEAGRALVCPANQSHLRTNTRSRLHQAVVLVSHLEHKPLRCWGSTTHTLTSTENWPHRSSINSTERKK